MSSLKVKPLKWRKIRNGDFDLCLRAKTIGGNAVVVRSIPVLISGNQIVAISFGMPATDEIANVVRYADSIEQAKAECEKIHAERVFQMASKFLTVEGE